MNYYIFIAKNQTLSSIYLKTDMLMPVNPIGKFTYYDEAGFPVVVDHDDYWKATQIDEKDYLAAVLKDFEQLSMFDAYSYQTKEHVIKCECGVDITGSGKHSTYCPKYREHE